jgi:hypothetical protein
LVFKTGRTIPRSLNGPRQLDRCQTLIFPNVDGAILPNVLLLPEVGVPIIRIEAHTVQQVEIPIAIEMIDAQSCKQLSQAMSCA